MAFRFRRSIKIAPGVKLNVSKRGISGISVGGFTYGRGGLYYNFDFPGVGLSYRTRLFGGRKKKKSSGSEAKSVGEFALGLHDSGALRIVDSRGKDLSDTEIKAVKKAQKADILAWLEERKNAFNDETADLLTLHHETPPPNNQKLHLEYKKGVDQWKEAAEQMANDDAIIEAILTGLLTELDWPRETAVSFAVIDNTVWLDVDLPEIEDLPAEQAHVHKTKMAITLKPISQKQQRLNYLQHIHAVAFRLIGDVFAHLPVITTVAFSGYSQRLDKQTAHVETDYLFSVQVPRDKWRTINFANLPDLDVVACFELFELRRKMTKTGLIRPIERFVPPVE